MKDIYHINKLLSYEHNLVYSSAMDFVKKEIIPYIETWAENHYFPKDIVPKMGQAGFFGPTTPQSYGGAGLDYTSYGLLMKALEHGDSAMRSTASVQGSLVMYPIYAFGSEMQRKKYLSKLANGEILGCFGLTEANHGSSPSTLESTLRPYEDGYLLNGSKLWITNAPIADIAIVWAKNHEQRITGVIVERGMHGFTTQTIQKKWSLRASLTGELVFQDVYIPKDNVLHGKDGLGAPLMCLDRARYGIAWGALGAAECCFETALQYTLERKQFGKPIAAFQLVQKKLSEMCTKLTTANLLAWRLGTLMDANQATTAQISMAKRNNVDTALEIARESRQILGALGITGDFPIMRHLMNLESVITYEGTHDIHLLILGRELTGFSAFE